MEVVRSLHETGKDKGLTLSQFRAPTIDVSSDVFFFLGSGGY